MRTVPFRLAHLEELEFGIPERAELKLLGPAVVDSLQQAQGPAWALLNSAGNVVGCFGMQIVGSDGVIWVLLSDEARKNPFGLHREASRCMKVLESASDVTRILGLVNDDYEPGRRWIEAFDFEPDAKLKMHGIHYTRYVKWPRAR